MCSAVIRSARSALLSSIFRTVLSTSLLTSWEAAYALNLDRTIDFDIAGDIPLRQALTRWTDLTAIQWFIAPGVLTTQCITKRLQGRLSAGDALKALLRGCGFDYAAFERTVVITRMGSQASQPAQMSGTRSESGKNDDVDSDKEVVVQPPPTGSHIREKQLASPGFVIGRQELDHSGYRTLAEVFRTIPQSFSADLNVYVIGAGSNGNTRSQSGTVSANLRGLGSGSTLTLLDGNRLPFAEGSSAVDLRQIPLEAVERIEVITDAASAVYGADAVAGVVNIILRKDYDGLTAAGEIGGAVQGGGALRHYSVIAGHPFPWNGGRALISVSGIRESDIDAQDRSYVAPSLAHTSLVPDTSGHSAAMVLSQALPGKSSAAVEAVGTKRSDTQSENLGSQVAGLASTDFPEVKQYVAVASAETELAGGWHAKVSAEVAADSVNVPESLTLYGAPYASRGAGGVSYYNRVRSVEVTGTGGMWRSQQALGAGYREETFSFANLADDSFRIARKRGVRFAYTESRAPLLGARLDEVGLRALTGSLAGRYERHTDFGSSANPKIGLTYRPIPDLQLRTSWGTSFRAPTLLQEYDIPQATLERVPDGPTATDTLIILQRFGGNQRLAPEKSDTLSFDITMAPRSLPGISMQLTWYRINYRGKIEIPTSNTGDPLPDATASFITRNPSVAQLAEIIKSSLFSNKTDAAYDPTRVGALVDDRYHNITREKASGFDLGSRYQHDIGRGELTASLDATYLDLVERVSDSSPMLGLSGTVFYPPRYRGRAGLSWKDSDLTASAFLNRSGPSRNVALTPPSRVPSWSTVDAQISYTNQRSGFWRGLSIALSAQNVFNKKPPHADVDQAGFSGLNFDPANSSPIGRFISLQLSSTWGAGSQDRSHASADR